MTTTEPRSPWLQDTDDEMTPRWTREAAQHRAIPGDIMLRLVDLAGGGRAGLTACESVLTQHRNDWERAVPDILRCGPQGRSRGDGWQLRIVLPVLVTTRPDSNGAPLERVGAFRDIVAGTPLNWLHADDWLNAPGQSAGHVTGYERNTRGDLTVYAALDRDRPDLRTAVALGEITASPTMLLERPQWHTTHTRELIRHSDHAHVLEVALCPAGTERLPGASVDLYACPDSARARLDRSTRAELPELHSSRAAAAAPVSTRTAPNIQGSNTYDARSQTYTRVTVPSSNLTFR